MMLTKRDATGVVFAISLVRTVETDGGQIGRVAASMPFFGVKVTGGETTWIEGSYEKPIQFKNACLEVSGKGKGGRIILQLCRESEERETSDTQTLGILSVADGGVENLKLDLLVNCRMGLKLTGKGSSGAVVHVIGRVLPPESDSSSSDEFDDDCIEFPDDLPGLDLLRAGGIGSSSDSGSDSDSDDAECENGSNSMDVSGNDVDQPDSGSTDPSRRGRKRKTEDSTDSKQAGKSKALVSKKRGRLVIHNSGLRFQELLVGAGKQATPGRNVAIHFQLRLETGKVVDKSGKNALKFRLGIGEVSTFRLRMISRSSQHDVWKQASNASVLFFCVSFLFSCALNTPLFYRVSHR